MCFLLSSTFFFFFFFNWLRTRPLLLFDESSSSYLSSSSPLKLCRVWLTFFCETLACSAKPAATSGTRRSLFIFCFLAYSHVSPLLVVFDSWSGDKHELRSLVCCNVCICTLNTDPYGTCLYLGGEEMCGCEPLLTFEEAQASLYSLQTRELSLEYKGGIRC